MPTKFVCILCQNQPADPEKPEHILLNALGGRMTSKTALCSDCNNRLGAGPDKELADSVASLRNIAGLKSGSGKPPPTLNYSDDDGKRIRLHEGRRIEAQPSKPWQKDNHGNYEISAANEAQFLQLLKGVAKKENMNETEQEAFIQSAMAQAIVHERPAPAIRRQLEFGSAGAQSSMLKACLVLWEKAVGNGELQHSRYDTARSFVFNGPAKHPVNSPPFAKISYSRVGSLPEKFGQHSNIIWAGSNNSGRAFGYFNLYGFAGWCFELCGAGATANKSIALVSNPFRNSNWECFSDASVGHINAGWVEHLTRAELKSLPNTEESVSSFLQCAHKAALEDAQLAMIEDSANYVGLHDGELIEADKWQAFTTELARRFTNQMLQLPDQRFLEPRRKT